jgi:hypothetical protein
MKLQCRLKEPSWFSMSRGLQILTVGQGRGGTLNLFVRHVARP